MTAMHFSKTILIIFLANTAITVSAQVVKFQQGLLLKSNSGMRLGGVKVVNKRSLAQCRSNIFGVFNMPATTGDTILIKSDNFQLYSFVVTDYADKIIYMDPVIQLNEVVVRENPPANEIKEVQRGYREKSVFYTGTPHYYYLMLKPMTFIYENFKSEVIEARRFNRFAKKEMVSWKVAERFNDAVVKKVVPIKDAELTDFELAYSPSIEKLNGMSDYDLINYIRGCYADFKKGK